MLTRLALTITALSVAFVGRVSALPVGGVSARWSRALTIACRAIRAQERALRNIRISARSVTYGENYDPGTKKWVWARHPLDRCTLTAVFDGTPRGMFRADVPLEKIGGNYGHSAEYFLKSFLVAYNGRVGTYLETAIASVGTSKMVAYNHGRICGGMPGEWSQVVGDAAWYSSVFGFTGSIPYGSFPRPRFSAFISPGQKGVTVSAGLVRRKGRRYLRVTRIGPPLGKDVFLLDPRKSYSIVKCAHYGWQPIRAANGHIRLAPVKRAEWIFRVTGFFRLAGGVFYPRRMVDKVFDPLHGEKLDESFAVDVSSVTINDPKVNGGTWVIRFPRGALIKDQATGRYLQVGGTPTQQLKEIEAAVKAAR